MTPETSLKKTIKDWLTIKRYFFWYSLQGLGAQKGIPDIFVLKEEKLYGIEAKSPRGKLSESQQHFKNELENNGGVYIIARSLEDVINVLI